MSTASESINGLHNKVTNSKTDDISWTWLEVGVAAEESGS